MANTARGRVLREFFLVAFIAAFVVPWGAATANMSAQLAQDVYGWEALNVIAGSSELRLHSLGDDVWEVWVCDTATGSVSVTPADVTAVLNAEVAPYYRWLSEEAYQPVFRSGGTVMEGSGCTNAVADRVTSDPNGVIIITDKPSNGGSAQSGIWCPYEGLCPASPEEFPDNFRSVTLGAHAVVGPNPRLVTVIHELGHTIHFGHSFSGTTTGIWAEYDNPIDVMSKAGDRTRLMGTLALNRYIAGWIPTDQVAVVDTPGLFTISAIGGGATKLLFVQNGEQGWYTTIDVRVTDGYDASLPRAGVTVHTLDQRAEACGSALPCFGLSRRVSQWPALGDTDGHLLEVGDQQSLPNGWILSVEGRVGDSFVVNLLDTLAPVFSGPVTAFGAEVSSVHLGWQAAQDEGPVTYEVLVGGEGVLETGETTAVITGLAPGRAHEIQVVARDNSGHTTTTSPIIVETLSKRDKWVAHHAGSGWWSFRLGEGATHTIYYGVPGDVPLLCDWDGDGVDTVGLYRPHEGFVYLRNSNTLGFADLDFFYGVPTDVPLCGDWDGDGSDSVGIYRPAEQRFYLRNSTSLGFADIVVQHGEPGDVPIVGDWDGDGVDTVAAYRPQTGTVYSAGRTDWPATRHGPMIIGDRSGTGSDLSAHYADGVITFVGEGGAQQIIRFGGESFTALAAWWD